MHIARANTLIHGASPAVYVHPSTESEADIIPELNSSIGFRPTRSRRKMQKNIAAFDVSGSGSLERDELKAYLASLSLGQEVSDDEVDYVFTLADLLCDGTLHTAELALATQIWQACAPKEKSSRACSIM